MEKMAAKRLEKELKIDMKFNDDFDPKRAKRNESKSIYGSDGRIRNTHKDVCDCLDNRCVGCHFPCKRCMSTKCGPNCRQNRNDYTTHIRIDGRNKKGIAYNPNFNEHTK